MTEQTSLTTEAYYLSEFPPRLFTRQMLLVDFGSVYIKSNETCFPRKHNPFLAPKWNEVIGSLPQFVAMAFEKDPTLCTTSCGQQLTAGLSQRDTCYERANVCCVSLFGPFPRVSTCHILPLSTHLENSSFGIQWRDVVLLVLLQGVNLYLTNTHTLTYGTPTSLQ